MGTGIRRDSTRTSRSRTFRMSSAVPRRRKPTVEPALDALLGRLSDAISMIRVSHRSLNASDLFGDEEFVLRTGLAALDALYSELDLAIIAVHTRTPVRKGGRGRAPTSRRRATHGSSAQETEHVHAPWSNFGTRKNVQPSPRPLCGIHSFYFCLSPCVTPQTKKLELRETMCIWML